MNDKGSFFSVVVSVGLAVVMGAGLVLGTLALAGGESPEPDLTAQAISTRFGSVQIDHDLNVDGDLTVAGTTTTGAQDLNGSELTLDADADTSITADTDDQIDFEVGGSDIFSATATGLFLSGSTNAAADVDVGTFLNLSAQATIAVTKGGAITPTGTYQVITSTAVVTTDTTLPIATSGFETGDVLILRNANASDTIAIDGTGGSVECKADVVLGASDTVTLIFNGTAWNCVANYDNS